MGRTGRDNEKEHQGGKKESPALIWVGAGGRREGLPMPVPSLVSPASCHLCLLAPPSVVSSRACRHTRSTHTRMPRVHTYAAMEDRHANPRERARARARDAHAAARTTSYAHHVRRSSRSIIS